MNSVSSPFLLLFRDATPEMYRSLAPEQRQELVRQWNAWYDGLVAEGKVEHGTPLEPQGRVVSGPRGEVITDGPFGETKEAIAGYFWLSVTDIDEATNIARGCPSLPLGISVEVRPIARFSPVLPDLHGRLPR